MFKATEARRPVSSTSSVVGFSSTLFWCRAPYCGGSWSAMVSMCFSSAMLIKPNGAGLCGEREVVGGWRKINR